MRLKFLRAIGFACWLLAPMTVQPALLTHQRWAVAESARAAEFYDQGDALQPGFVPTFQAIIGQESSFCADKHHRDPDSWGCGQLTVKTARIFDKSATAWKLMHRDRYNIWLAAAYLAYCHRSHADWTDMVRCYHGWKSADWTDYVDAIKKRLSDADGADSDD